MSAVLRSPITLVLAALIALSALALRFTPIGQAAEAAAPLAVGAVAPEIQLGDQHGHAFSLSDTLKQRAFIVLAFYPKAFTAG